jgi:hypothetical protein
MRQSRVALALARVLRAADAQVVEFGGLRPQTRLDISETLAKRQLRKCHREVLIQTSETLDLVMSTVSRHTATKRRQRQMLHQLRKDQLPCMHQSPPRRYSSQGGKLQVQSSNRDQTNS